MNLRLAVAALIGLASSMSADARRPSVTCTPRAVDKIDTGRRAEKDARALAKAEAKRARRAAKRSKT